MDNPVHATPAKNVNDYLEMLPPDVRTLLEKVRQAIKAAAPNAEEVISYQIPTYKSNGPVVHFAAFKDHCSFTFVSENILKLFRKELEPFKVSGRTIHFSTDKPLPAGLIQKIVKTRMKENEERIAAGKSGKGKQK